ncbi:hypothetical protein IAT38_003136 [Cryptococcus sp. DSM 104549]
MPPVAPVTRKPVPPLSLALPDNDFGSAGMSLPSTHPFANPSPGASRSSSREDLRRLASGADLRRTASVRSGPHGAGIERRGSPLSARGVVSAHGPVPPHRSASASREVERGATPEVHTPDSEGGGARAEWLSSAPGSRGGMTPPLAAALEQDRETGVQLDKVNKRLSSLSLSVNRPLPPIPTRPPPVPPSDASSPSPWRASFPAYVHTGHHAPTISHESLDSTSTTATSPSLPSTPLSATHDPRQIAWDPSSSSHLLSAPQARSSPAAASASTGNVLPRPSSLARHDSNLSAVSGSSKPDGEKKRVKGGKAKALYPGEPDEDRVFSVDRVPSKARLLEAASCFVRDEDGELVSFGDFFPPSGPSLSGAPVQKTVVFFIRAFWCGQCQDYTLASISILSPEALEKAGIRVIVIGQGSWKIIKAYKKLFGCPFPIYVDSPRGLYAHMGMTKMMTSWGPWFNGRAEYHQSSVPSQLRKGIHNGLFKMPLAHPGKIAQLGGEFILTPKLGCEFAHRMTHASDHMEAPDVLRLAGCEYPTNKEVREIELADSQKEELAAIEREMTRWREGRTAELEQIKARKAARRGLRYIPSNAEHSDPQLQQEPLEASEVSHPSAGKQQPPVGGGDAILAYGKTAAQLESEWDDRFARVMREEEAKARERAAAKMFATCLVAPPEDVGAEYGEEVMGEVIMDGERGLAV